jgi:phage baseplate assembly protein gpV
MDIPSGGAFEIHVGGAVILLDNGKCRITVGSKSLELNATKATWNGDLDVNGNINATGDVIAGSISLQNHTHTGVQPGGGTTGPPT